MNTREKIFLWIFIISSLALDLAQGEACTDGKTGEAGECVEIRQCPEKLNRFRSLKEMPTICDYQTRSICCPIKSSPASIRIAAKKCREFSSRFEKRIKSPDMSNRDPIYETVKECPHEATPLITGGEEAREKEFPHMALIGYGEGKSDDYLCCGPLISDQWILSAAHCLNSRSSGPANFAKLGNVIRSLETEFSSTHKIVQRIPHPNFSRRFADNDIALFKLDNQIEFNDYISPICLPSIDRLTTHVIASGWGKTGYLSDPSERLMKVTIEYFERDTCESAYEASRMFSKNSVDWDRMICAGSTNKTGDTCNGDSGGPIQVSNEETEFKCTHTIVGVTSFGSIYCGTPGVPAIYTKVQFYLDWIESIVWPN